MLDIVNCFILIILALAAALITLIRSRYEEAGAAWLKLIIPYRRLEAFWRVFFVHVTFAAIALAAVTPTHIRNSDLGYGGAIIIIVANIVVAIVSQVQLEDQMTEAMTPERRQLVIRLGIIIGILYLLTIAFVAYGALTKKEGQQAVPHASPTKRGEFHADWPCISDCRSGV